MKDLKIFNRVLSSMLQHIYKRTWNLRQHIQTSNTKKYISSYVLHVLIILWRIQIDVQTWFLCNVVSNHHNQVHMIRSDGTPTHNKNWWLVGIMSTFCLTSVSFQSENWPQVNSIHEYGVTVGSCAACLQRVRCLENLILQHALEKCTLQKRMRLFSA